MSCDESRSVAVRDVMGAVWMFGYHHRLRGLIVVPRHDVTRMTRAPLELPRVTLSRTTAPTHYNNRSVPAPVHSIQCMTVGPPRMTLNNATAAYVPLDKLCHIAPWM